MVCPDDVTLAGFAIVVVTTGAVVVVVVVTIGAAVVVVAATVVVVVTTVAGFGVVTVAGFDVVDVVAVLDAGELLAGAEVGDVGLAGVAEELEDGGTEGVDGVAAGASGTAGASGAAGAAEADLTTRGTPPTGSAAAGSAGTVSSTRMVVSGWPGAPFLVTTCFLFTTRTDAGPPETAGTAPAVDGALKPRMRTPESAATESAPVASTSTPAEAAASAFFLNMDETVTIVGLAVG
jgi:pilus assembly protein FimV